MSVLLTGMRMPESCYACSLRYACDLAAGNGWIIDQRDPKCPLINVAVPHGRLGDIDAAAERLCIQSERLPFHKGGKELLLLAAWLRSEEEVPTVIGPERRNE